MSVAECCECKYKANKVDVKQQQTDCFIGLVMTKVF